MDIDLKDGEVAKTQKIDDDTLVDLDAKGRVLSIELLFVRERGLLKKFEIENLVSSKKMSVDLKFLNELKAKHRAVEVKI